jgi:hypothetical protein
VNSGVKKPLGLPFHEGARAIRERVEKLVRDEDELCASALAALSGEAADEKSVARLLGQRCLATRESITLIFRWMCQLDRRIGQIESHLSGLANRAADQEETMRMMCSLLKELDDPYGFGTSLDERVFGEAGRNPCDEQD